MAASMAHVLIGTPERQTRAGYELVTSDIAAGGRNYRVSFRSAQGPLGDSAEPFVDIALLPAMKAGASLHVQGGVSARLLTQLPHYQGMMHNWYPWLQISPICAVPVDPGPAEGAQQRGVGCFFSAGVDSFYSALTHLDEITHLVFIHGFDVALLNHELREKVIRGVRSAAGELGKPLIEVETNARDLLDAFTDWGHESHGTLLAAVAHLLSPQLRRVYIPASYAYRNLFPWGSHPLTDPLFSTEMVTLEHDGCGASRMDKVKMIAANETAMRWLRVCWASPTEYNCGRCGKCLRVMTALHLAGALDRCATFDRSLDLDVVATSRVGGLSQRIFFDELLAEAQARPDQADLAQALSETLAVSPGASVADQDRLREVEDQVHRLQARVQWMEESRSWRMTAPLRRAVAGARRMQQGRWLRRR